jgi:hypothetical protein
MVSLSFTSSIPTLFNSSVLAFMLFSITVISASIVSNSLASLKLNLLFLATGAATGVGAVLLFYSVV